MELFDLAVKIPVDLFDTGEVTKNVRPVPSVFRELGKVAMQLALIFPPIPKHEAA